MTRLIRMGSWPSRRISVGDVWKFSCVLLAFNGLKFKPTTMYPGEGFLP